MTSSDVSAKRDGDELVIEVAGRSTTRVKDHFGDGRIESRTHQRCSNVAVFG